MGLRYTRIAVLPTQADYVVIGGGCMGTSIALHLARLGASNILLLERNTLASGTTGRSSAIIRTHYSTETLARMAQESLHVFAHFDEQIGGTAGFTPCGALFLGGAEDYVAMQANVAMHRGLGIDTHLLTPHEVEVHEPQIDMQDVMIAAYEPHSGYADPAATTASYAAAAQRLGVRIAQETRATGLRMQGGRISAVETNHGEVATHVVINATNVWANELNRLVGMALPLRPTRHPLAVVVRPPGFGMAHRVIADFVQETYLKPETGGLSLIGSLDPIHDRSEVDPDNISDSLDMQSQMALVERAARRFPRLTDAGIRRGFAGLYDTTPDQHPVLDQLTEGGVEGFYVACGFSGHGFKLSPMIGRMMAEYVLDGYAHHYDINLFSAERFKDGALIRSRYSHATIA